MNYKPILYLIIITTTLYSCTLNTDKKVDIIEKLGIQKECNNGIQDAKKELSYGNLIYYYLENEINYNPRFEELLFNKLNIVAIYEYRLNHDQECFKEIMDSVINATYGQDTILALLKESKKINSNIPDYLNMDSTYNFCALKPTYPGGKGFFDIRLLRFNGDSINQYTEVWVDVVIDTNGSIISNKIIKKYTKNWNDTILNSFKYFLPFTPAYRIIPEANKNIRFWKFEKVKYKLRLIFKITKD